MKNLKIKLLLSCTAVAMIVLISSCDKDPCKNVTCENGGVGQDILGICICDCPDGFDGDFCENDLCANVNCQNGGTMVVTVGNCSCTCPAGTSGDNCETKDRDALLGTAGVAATWQVSETCTQTGNAVYTVVISASATDIDKILVQDMGGYVGVSGTLTIDGNQVTMPTQTHAGAVFDGTGVLNTNGTLTMTYTVDDGTAVDNCTGTWEKQ